jgi:hypothetical protein
MAGTTAHDSALSIEGITNYFFYTLYGIWAVVRSALWSSESSANKPAGRRLGKSHSVTPDQSVARSCIRLGIQMSSFHKV